jgi:hypothetical protein
LLFDLFVRHYIQKYSAGGQKSVSIARELGIDERKGTSMQFNMSFFQALVFADEIMR